MSEQKNTSVLMMLNREPFIRTFSDLESLFTSNDQTQPIDSIENAILIDGFDLCTFFPAQYVDKRKSALIERLISKHKYEPTKRQVLITRFYPKPLPSVYRFEEHIDPSKTYEFLSNVFDYKSIEDRDVVQWHMNFANHDLFSYYPGSLLAQDELQVLECPQLASLREYLIQQSNSTKPFSPRVVEANQPYPILISNVERVLELDTTNLYGNQFSSASESTVLKSYKYLDPYQTVNIVAIEAPKYGQGSYTIQQITYILQACYTAYSSAKLLADITFSLNDLAKSSSTCKTHIHTGWFGCGAYGGNRIIMIILQILAAKFAGIEKLIFHTVNNDCEDEKRQAIDILNNLFDGEQTPLFLHDLIEKIYQKRFQWSSSNRT